MPPPNNRRSGFSKRAQFNVFYGYIAGIVGLLLGAVLVVVSLKSHDAFSDARGVAADAAAPIARAVAVGRDDGRSVFSAIGGFFTSGARNARMQKEIEVARVRLAEAEDLRAENARLKALLGIPREVVQPVATARLIASTPGSSRRFATLSVGANVGVAVGMPVRSALGLVGRVLEVSAKTARILLVTDGESLVPVRRARDGVDAFAQGNGDGRLVLKLINLGPNPLQPGDVMVTSGSGGLYHPGIGVAVVTELTRDGAFAKVLSDPSTSEFVLVDQPFSASVGIPAVDIEPPASAKPIKPGKP